MFTMFMSDRRCGKVEDTSRILLPARIQRCREILCDIIIHLPLRIPARHRPVPVHRAGEGGHRKILPPAVRRLGKVL